MKTSFLPVLMIVAFSFGPSPAFSAPQISGPKKGCEAALEADPASDNLFTRLGLPSDGKDVDLAAVKSAGRKASKKFHPDTTGNADSDAIRNITDARKGLDSEDKICAYRDSLTCAVSTRLRAIYDGAIPAKGANLRERQQAVNELEEDLKAGLAKFNGRVKGQSNEYFYGTFLRDTKNEKRFAETLARFADQFQREKQKSFEYGFAASLLHTDQTAMASLLSIFFSRELPHAFRIQLALQVIKSDYDLQLGGELLIWSLARTSRQDNVVRDLYSAISEMRTQDKIWSQKASEVYGSKDRSPESSTNLNAHSARAAIHLLTDILPAFVDAESFKAIYQKTVSLFSESSISDYRGIYLSLRSYSHDNSEKAKLISVGLTRFGNISALLDNVKGAAGSRILALTDWNRILEAGAAASYTNPEFEFIIYGLFSNTREDSLFNKEAATILESLAAHITDNKLFEHDVVLALAEKYPLFEKWATDQLDIAK